MPCQAAALLLPLTCPTLRRIYLWCNYSLVELTQGNHLTVFLPRPTSSAAAPWGQSFRGDWSPRLWRSSPRACFRTGSWRGSRAGTEALLTQSNGCRCKRSTRLAPAGAISMGRWPCTWYVIAGAADGAERRCFAERVRRGASGNLLSTATAR